MPVYSAPVDLVLLNGNIYTADDRDRFVQGLAVAGGKIVARGTTHDIRALCDKHTRTVDLGGKTVLPGFNDAHAHLDMYAMMTSRHAVDCRIPALGSVDEILSRIRERAAAVPPGQLILGQGRPSQPFPTKAQLDTVAPDHPVIIKASMHWFMLNGAALKKFNITSRTPTDDTLRAIDPCGVIERDEATGAPTGYLEESWNYLFPRSQSPLDEQQTTDAIRHGLRTANVFGVTSITELLCHPESPRIYQKLQRAGDLTTRIQLVPCMHGLYRTVALPEIINAGLTSGFGDQWIKFGGMKLFLENHQFTPSCTAGQLNAWVAEAHGAGLRVYMHAISRKAQAKAIAAIEATAEIYGRDSVRRRRHRVEHMGNEDLDPTFFPRMQALGAIPVPTAYFMNMGPATLVTPRTPKSFMFKTLLAQGFKVPGNSDTAGAVPEALNPMYQIWCMLNRQTRDGQPVCPEEKIGLMDAIKVFTRHSAHAGCEEDIKGTIEVAKLADLIVLDRDPFATAETELRDIAVDMTIVNGKVVYRRQDN